jgi:hypothetical protein
MESDSDLTLDSDRLEQLLEAPPPPQPVVVVEYRNRGVPIGIFFPLIVLVPLGALLVYHRTVIQRDRAEAAQTRQSLENLAAKAATSLPPQPATANPAPGGTLFLVESGNSPTSPASSPGLPTTTSSALDSFQGTGVATKAGAATEGGLSTANPPTQTGTARADISTATPTVGTVPPPSDPAADAQANRRPTMRSILPNPFADGTKPPQPPAPGEGTASRPAETKEPTSPVAGQSEPGARPPAQVNSDNDPPQPANELANRDQRLALQPPLPTKEESERQIREEAAKKQADRFAQVENRLASQHSHWLEEQIKFREELSEAIRSHGNQAGPEIDKLAKRYGTEVDDVKWRVAYRAWRFSRGLSQSAKVKYIRELELPEVVILDFISDDLHPQVKKRGGPKNESEVRARAAKQLLSYVFPGTEASPAAGGEATGTEPAQTQVPSPTNGARHP